MGHRENEDFAIAVWFTAGAASELPQMASKMLESGVEVVVTVGPLEADAAARATDQIPIVFINVEDPIAQGLIESYARPGGNITGVADGGFGISARRLELFAAIAPGMRRVLLPYNQANPHHSEEVEEYVRLAERMGLTLVPHPIEEMAGADELAIIATPRKH